MNLRFLSLLVLTAAVTAPASAQSERFVKFPHGPKVDVFVPMGYSFEARNNSDGSVGIRMENPVWRIGIIAVIANERSAPVTQRDWQQSKLIEHIAQHMSRAREDDYTFKPLTPVKGSGLYCVFSSLGADAAGEVAAGGNTHVTGGLKSWRGCVVLFHIFSNGVQSPEYQEAFDLFSWSFTEAN